MQKPKFPISLQLPLKRDSPDVLLKKFSDDPEPHVANEKFRELCNAIAALNDLTKQAFPKLDLKVTVTLSKADGNP